MRVFAVLIGMACVGCFYTDPIAGDEDTRFYSGTCRCLLCMDPAAPPGFCNGPTTIDDVPLEFCHIDIEGSLAVAKLTTLCRDVEESLNAPAPMADGVVAQCGLIPVNNDPDMFEELVNRGSERGVCQLEDRFRDPVGAAFASRATLHSQIRASGPSLSAVADVTGEVEFYGGNCRTGACPIRIMWLKLQGPRADITVDGESRVLRNIITVNQTEGTGTCSSLAPSFDACGFLLDPGSLDIMTSAFNPSDDERQIIYASSTNTGGGILSFQNHAIAVTQVFSGNGADIEFSLTGTVDNFAPYVSAPAAFTVSCGRGVTIDTLVEDVDDPLSTLDIRWYVDGHFVRQGPGPLTTDLATGTHTITVLARDSHGAFGSNFTTVTVEPDTTPPQIVTSAPVCVWPPNHDYDLLTASDLSVLAVDDCDPSPTVRFVGGASSQPDNGLGDGNTSRDIVVHADSVCVRSERSGLFDIGRRYELQIVAVDAAGNTSQPATTEIAVPHDQSKLDRCAFAGGTAVDEDDPRCSPVNALPSGRIDSQSSGGCSTGEPAGLLVALGLFAVRRRRKR